MEAQRTSHILVTSSISLTAEETRLRHRDGKQEPEENGAEKDSLNRTQTFSSTDLERLTRASFSHLFLNRQNAGKCVLVRVLEDGYSREEGPWFNVVEDVKGLVIGLALYNYPKDQLFPRGTAMLIKEPYCKITMGFPFIRCDCPTDVIVLSPSHKRHYEIVLNEWSNPVDVCEDELMFDPIPSDPDEWKERGDQLLEQNRLLLAREAYVLGLKLCPEIDSSATSILLKMFQVQNALGFHEWVVNAASWFLHEEKALFEMGKAYYSLRLYDEAAYAFWLLIDNFELDKIDLNEFNMAYGMTLDREEEREGRINVGKLKKMAIENPYLEIECADFYGPLQQVEIEGKGRGLVLTKDVKKGEVLIVTKAIAATLDALEFRDAQERIIEEYAKVKPSGVDESKSGEINVVEDEKNAESKEFDSKSEESNEKSVKSNEESGETTGESNVESDLLHEESNAESVVLEESESVHEESNAELLQSESNSSAVSETSVDSEYQRAKVVSKLAELVFKNPIVFGSMIFSLYSGFDFGDPIRWRCVPSDEESDEVVDVNRINEIYVLNAFTLIENDHYQKKGCGLFHVPSFLNHSCQPNADPYEFYNDVMVVRALRDMEAGTEVTICYVDSNLNHQERAKLTHGRNFTCNCARCIKERHLDLLFNT